MLTGVEEFLIFGFLPLMIGIFAAPLVADVAERTVSGKVIVPHPAPFRPTPSRSSNSSSCAAARPPCR